MSVRGTCHIQPKTSRWIDCGSIWVPNPFVHIVRRRYIGTDVEEPEISSITGDCVGGAATRIIGDALGLCGGLNKRIVEVGNTSTEGSVHLVPTTGGSGVTESSVIVERPAQIDRVIAFLVTEVIPATIAHSGTAALIVRSARCVQAKTGRLITRDSLWIPNPFEIPVPTAICINAVRVHLGTSSAGKSILGAATRIIRDVLGLRGDLNKGIVEVRNTSTECGVHLVPSTSGSSVTESFGVDVLIERPAQINWGVAFLVAEVISKTIAHVGTAALSVRGTIGIQRKATRLKGRHPIGVPNPFVILVPTTIKGDA